MNNLDIKEIEFVISNVKKGRNQRKIYFDKTLKNVKLINCNIVSSMSGGIYLSVGFSAFIHSTKQFMFAEWNQFEYSGGNNEIGILLTYQSSEDLKILNIV